MKTKAIEILKEEYKKAGMEIAEEALEKTAEVLFEKVLPRIAIEDENPIVKSISGVVLLAYPALKPALQKATDLNHDGE